MDDGSKLLVKPKKGRTKRCAWGACNSDSKYSDRGHMKDVDTFVIIIQQL